jgi:transcriptional regulator with XRE-family HTH domain
MTETVQKAFGDELKTIRNKAGQTQEGVSLSCDMSLRYYQYLENGDNNPTMITLFRLADTLGCEPEKLIKSAWEAWKKESRKSK